MLNTNFESIQYLQVGLGKNEKTLRINYQDEKSQALEQLQEVRRQGIIKTSNISFGLGGKTF